VREKDGGGGLPSGAAARLGQRRNNDVGVAPCSAATHLANVARRVAHDATDVVAMRCAVAVHVVVVVVVTIVIIIVVVVVIVVYEPVSIQVARLARAVGAVIARVHALPCLGRTASRPTLSKGGSARHRHTPARSPARNSLGAATDASALQHGVRNPPVLALLNLARCGQPQNEATRVVEVIVSKG
jgi:hypothetical protein